MAVFIFWFKVPENTKRRIFGAWKCWDLFIYLFISCFHIPESKLVKSLLEEKGHVITKLKQICPVTLNCDVI